MAGRKSQNPESVVREIRRKTRRKFSIEEKIRIMIFLLIVVSCLPGSKLTKTIC